MPAPELPAGCYSCWYHSAAQWAALFAAGSCPASCRTHLPLLAGCPSQLHKLWRDGCKRGGPAALDQPGKVVQQKLLLHGLACRVQLRLLGICEGLLYLRNGSC